MRSLRKRDSLPANKTHRTAHRPHGREPEPEPEPATLRPYLTCTFVPERKQSTGSTLHAPQATLPRSPDPARPPQRPKGPPISRGTALSPPTTFLPPPIHHLSLSLTLTLTHPAQHTCTAHASTEENIFESPLRHRSIHLRRRPEYRPLTHSCPQRGIPSALSINDNIDPRTLEPPRRGIICIDLRPPSTPLLVALVLSASPKASRSVREHVGSRVSLRLASSSVRASMPSRLDAPVLTVDVGLIHKVDTRNVENLFSMWTGKQSHCICTR